MLEPRLQAGIPSLACRLHDAVALPLMLDLGLYVGMDDSSTTLQGEVSG